MEKLQKMSDSPLLDCPACETPSLKKRVSAAGFRLSGAGWYESDFKTGSKKNMVEGSKEPAAPACATGGCGGCAAE